MTKKETIKRIKMQVLYAFYKETKFAKTAKVPMKFIQKKFRSDLRGFVKEAIEQLAKDGHIILMKRQTEYVLIWTDKGISATKKILERK
jgi:hypothetical protein